MANSDLTSSKVAERLSVAHSTVRAWCNRGLFPNAARHETPAGSFWLIPEKDLKEFKPPTKGRPPKLAGTGKRATAPANASNGRSTGKKRGKK